MALSIGAHADVGDQIGTLLADDVCTKGLAGFAPSFGSAVDVDGARAIVAAEGCLSAYLFDLLKGEQIAELGGFAPVGIDVGISGEFAVAASPGLGDGELGLVRVYETEFGELVRDLLGDDVLAGDGFGDAVAIDGPIVLVSAPSDDNENGTSAGAVYVFDVESGQQLRKLIAPDAGVFQYFGDAVSLDGTLAAIGAPGTEVVHLFDVTTGSLVRTLEADPPVPDDEFGHAVDLQDGVAVVGAPRDGAGGENAGAAYLFDAETGFQIARVVANEPEEDERIGDAVAVAAGAAVVGSRSNFSGGPGRALLLDATTGSLVVELTSGEANGDAFGRAVAIDGPTALVGAPFAVNFAGAGFLFRAVDEDSDGDGLLDSWEVEGIPYVDENGRGALYVLDTDGDGQSDADPFHKDLFVEIDRMTGVPFSAVAKEKLLDAFADAPLENPDGTFGITLHLVLDDAEIPFEQVSTTPEGEFPLGASLHKAQFFGTKQERNGPSGFQKIFDAKAKAYRYCLVYNDSTLPIGGRAELGGDDMVLFVGGYTDTAVASVFMHELGHCLGLRHGGCDSINGKPNYPSIMNYTLAYREPWNQSFWRLDYSRRALASIDEDNVSELVSTGLGGGDEYVSFFLPFQGVVPDRTPCAPPELWGESLISYADLDPAVLTDYSLDCDVEDDGLDVDLNFIPGSTLPGALEPSPGEVLHGHDDWAAIQLAVSSSGAFLGSIEPDEVTDEQRAFMNEHFDPPPCAADLDGDGVIAGPDVGLLLGAWGPCVICPADLDANDVVDSADLGLLLAAWGPCGTER